MSCKEIKTKKYQERNSPPYSAMDCKNKIKKGKDGTYKSTPDKNNIFKWIKITSKKSGSKESKKVSKKYTSKPTAKPKHIYKIHENGEIPFLVYDYGTKVDIYKHTNNTSKKILDLKYKKIFIGDNMLKFSGYAAKTRYKGNTILLEISPNEYVYIGNQIKAFETKLDDIIKRYVSPIGNSDVPYPYAIGENFTYLMLENKYIPNEFVDLTKDVYAQYYGFDKKNISNKKIITESKKYPVKILAK
jgi:hypothetical protein